MFKKWNAHTFGNIASQIAKSKDILSDLKSKPLDGPTVEDIFKEEKKLDILLKSEEMFWAQKVRVN